MRRFHTLMAALSVALCLALAVFWTASAALAAESPCTSEQTQEYITMYRTKIQRMQRDAYQVFYDLGQAHKKMALVLEMPEMVGRIDGTLERYARKPLKAADVKALTHYTTEFNKRILAELKLRTMMNGSERRAFAHALDTFKEAAIDADAMSSKAQRLKKELTEVLRSAEWVDRLVMRDELDDAFVTIPSLIKMNMDLTTTGLQLVQLCQALHVDVGAAHQLLRQTNVYRIDAQLWTHTN